jgi:hypothetical protein
MEDIALWMDKDIRGWNRRHSRAYKHQNQKQFKMFYAFHCLFPSFAFRTVVLTYRRTNKMAREFAWKCSESLYSNRFDRNEDEFIEV